MSRVKIYQPFDGKTPQTIPYRCVRIEIPASQAIPVSDDLNLAGYGFRTVPLTCAPLVAAPHVVQPSYQYNAILYPCKVADIQPARVTALTGFTMREAPPGGFWVPASHTVDVRCRFTNMSLIVGSALNTIVYGTFLIFAWQEPVDFTQVDPDWMRQVMKEAIYDR